MKVRLNWKQGELEIPASQEEYLASMDMTDIHEAFRRDFDDDPWAFIEMTEPYLESIEVLDEGVGNQEKIKKGGTFDEN